MVDKVAIYTIIHQPRRLRLPAYPLDPAASIDEIERGIFDDALNQYYFEKVARYCYHPAIELFLDLVGKGFHFSMGITNSFLDQAIRWDMPLVDKLKALVGHPNVELVCVEPYHSFIFYVDIQKFQERMRWARRYLTKFFGKRPEVAETTEMFMSRHLYNALERLGFKATLVEGRERALGWRSATYLYNQGKKMAVFARHKDLSDDVGYRFSQRSWEGYPLNASTYSEWIRSTGGDVVFVGWDFETFGEHHNRDTGIFDFLRWLPGELHYRGVQTLTFSETLEKLKRDTFPIDLPVHPVTWAGLNGDQRFFFGNPAQFQILLSMHHAYNIARLSGNRRLMDIALWLCQSDNLHLLQWQNSADTSEAEVSSYFTPSYWWALGANRIPTELQRVYEQFISYASHLISLKKPRLKFTEEQPKNKEVAFEIHAPRAESVSVIGDFTGWKATPVPLRPETDGHWRGSVCLDPGIYEYKYLVDGRFLCDPSCHELVPDGFGAANCVLTVE
ncbi:MAG: glycoside hydrolase [Chloroflexi bacterium]|nr:glycoside hydrolase [Chloroflexota bacterium]